MIPLWESSQCETTGGFPPARSPVTDGAERLEVSFVERQFLGGLIPPISLSPEACNSKGDSAESDPMPSGGAGGGSAVSLGRSRAARGCSTSGGGKAVEGTRAGALWIRGCLDSQASARSQCVGAQTEQTAQGARLEHARCRGHC